MVKKDDLGVLGSMCACHMKNSGITTWNCAIWEEVGKNIGVNDFFPKIFQTKEEEKLVKTTVN